MRYGFDVEHVSRVDPITLDIKPPPIPIEPGKSKPRRAAGHAIAYTLYAMGWWHRQPGNIPGSIRVSRHPRAMPLYSPVGRKTQTTSSMVPRNTPQSYSDNVLGQ